MPARVARHVIGFRRARSFVWRGMRVRRRSNRWLVLLLLLGVTACGQPALLPPVLPAAADEAVQAAAPAMPAASTPDAARPAATATPLVSATPVTPAPAGVTVPPAPAAGVLSFPDEFVYVPASAAARQPATVLVTLHGMGGEGRVFCRGLLAEADRNGWVLVAPTFRYYENWHDPAAVLKDDVAVVQRLKAMLDQLPELTGLRLRQRVLLYGFSRGSQVAHRFALVYPRRVLGVAALAAGAYTLPVEEWTGGGGRRALPLPFGTADMAQQFGQPADFAALKQVRFWVAVGGSDNRDADVPAAWTPYIGPNRLARARAFKEALDRLGVPAVLTVFPGAGHNETPEMRAAASSFLREASAG